MIEKDNTQYRHKTLLENAHDMAKDLYEAGMMDNLTMRKYDALCLKTDFANNGKENIDDEKKEI